MHSLFIFTTSTLVSLVGVLAAPLPLPDDFPGSYSVHQFGKPLPQASPSYYKVETIGGVKAAPTSQKPAQGSSYKPYKVDTIGGTKAAPTDQMAPATTQTRKSQQDGPRIGGRKKTTGKHAYGPNVLPGSVISIGGHKVELRGGRPVPRRYNDHLMGEIKAFFSRNRKNKLGDRIKAMTPEELDAFEKACRPKAPVKLTPPSSPATTSPETTNGKGSVEHAASSSSSAPAVVPAKQSATSPETVSGVEQTAPSKEPDTPSPQSPAAAKTWSGAAGNMLSGAASSTANAAYGVASSAYKYLWGSKVKQE